MENIRKAARVHPCDIRVPLIGINDSDEDQRDFRIFQNGKGKMWTLKCCSIMNSENKKWHQCGWEYQMTDAAHVSDERVKQFREAIIKSELQYVRT